MVPELMFFTSKFMVSASLGFYIPNNNIDKRAMVAQGLYKAYQVSNFGGGWRHDNPGRLCLGKLLA